MALTDGTRCPSAEDVRRRRLLRACRRGDRGAEARLVEEYLPLLRHIAAQYRGYGLAQDDLVQEGAIGLLDAIARYDPGRGRPFDSYARFRIRRMIKRALTDQARLIRLPKHIVERRRAILRAENGLLTRGLPTTPQALADATGLSVRAVLEATGAPHAPLSLDEAGAAGAPAVSAVGDERIDGLERTVAQLPQRQRELIVRRFGLAGDKPLSAVRIAAELELSPRRTQTIARETLDALRRDLESAEA